jgi:hypothetical protein
MEAIIENNEEDQQQVQQAEQKRIAAAGRRIRRMKLISVLEGCDECPFRTRNKTDELVQ